MNSEDKFPFEAQDGSPYRHAINEFNQAQTRVIANLLETATTTIDLTGTGQLDVSVVKLIERFADCVDVINTELDAIVERVDAVVQLVLDEETRRRAALMVLPLFKTASRPYYDEHQVREDIESLYTESTSFDETKREIVDLFAVSLKDDIDAAVNYAVSESERFPKPVQNHGLARKIGHRFMNAIVKHRD